MAYTKNRPLATFLVVKHSTPEKRVSAPRHGVCGPRLLQARLVDSLHLDLVDDRYMV